MLQIFDSITRLSSVFMKLCSSGCVLFKDWRGRFLCDPQPKRPVCAILEFGQGDEVPQLKVNVCDAFLCPPSKKRGYIILLMSVGLSVCRYVGR